MQRSSSRRAIALIWLTWVVILLGYQGMVSARITLQKPDLVLDWTAGSTQTDSQNDQPYLLEPFLNAQVSWDSEFYLSIATQGYDDPTIRSVPTQPDAAPPLDRPLSLNYAFFPVYPHLMRVLAFPLRAVGLNPIAAATLAGVIISTIGTLAAMLALADLADKNSPATGLRSAFYLIVFPTGFFLAQVYTEGLFTGLAFSSLALLRHKRWLWASGLATVATLTRAVGVALLIPLAIDWVRTFIRQPDRRLLLVGQGLVMLAPLWVHLIWRSSFYGGAFKIVEREFFRFEFLAIDRAWAAWSAGFLSLFGDNPQTVVYYAIEFGAIGLGITTCLLTLRRNPGMALYGLLAIGVSLTGGIAQGMHRYILVVPSVFLVLGEWGESAVFDRAWTLTSVLLMGLLATLFTFDLWVG